MPARTRQSSRQRAEDYWRPERFYRPQHLCPAILCHRHRPRAGLPRAAVSGLVPAHELGMAADRPRGDLLGAAHRRKNLDIDTLYISENGTSSEDKLAADGQLYDLDRIMFLRNYLTQMQRAITEGVPIRGYFLWSLMDNFEWIVGCGKRFG